jgi:Fur family peroxide stress response transcriptional regulator
MEEFRRKGFRATPQRIAIAQIVLNSKDHPTAEQLYQALKKKYPTLSSATMYQTLHLLTEIGLLQELGFSDRGSRYDPDTSPHINIVCKNCGKIQDYQAESVKKLWSEVIGDLGFKPTGQRLDIYRYCDKCQPNTHSNQVL